MQKPDVESRRRHKTWKQDVKTRCKKKEILKDRIINCRQKF